ncbi:MAG: hypothetical protein V4501_04310 [Pseudomonadota bacterium]
MTKIHSDVINYFIKLYEDHKKSQWPVQAAGDYFSAFTGSAHSVEILQYITKLKPIINKLDKEPACIVEVLTTLGYIGRISQQNKLVSFTGSECRKIAFAACSYIHYIIHTYPNENSDFKAAIDQAVEDFEAKYVKLVNEYNEKDPTAIETSNKAMDGIICDLATLGKPKRLLIANRIYELYGKVEMPPKSIFNGVSQYNTALPLILHSQFYVHDFLALSNTKLGTFIEMARVEFKKTDDNKNTSTNSSKPTGTGATPNSNFFRNSSDQVPDDKKTDDKKDVDVGALQNSGITNTTNTINTL